MGFLIAAFCRCRDAIVSQLCASRGSSLAAAYVYIYIYIRKCGFTCGQAILQWMALDAQSLLIWRLHPRDVKRPLLVNLLDLMVHPLSWHGVSTYMFWNLGNWSIREYDGYSIPVWFTAVCCTWGQTFFQWNVKAPNRTWLRAVCIWVHPSIAMCSVQFPQTINVRSYWLQTLEQRYIVQVLF